MTMQAIRSGESSKLRELIDRRGIKYTWVARSVGVSKSHLGNIVNLKRNCPDELAVQIAGVLDVAPQELFVEVSSMSP